MSDETERGGHGLTDEQQRELRARLNSYTLAPAYSPYSPPTMAVQAFQPLLDVLGQAEGPVTFDAVDMIEALTETADMAWLAGNVMPDHAEKAAHLISALVLRAVASNLLERLT